ncbi:MAG: 2-amino-4-hydroxy-6-hydroxymethyldihydropteridine diphosphokinase [Desulfobacula sp. RIFOXYA12_FULL_46_16]|nr:MAG: 2-amino-4-hydroxy-6-hydroxymethyldihydropteridine diphosphokinase [Deltaproteobacteria bacterium RIFOXYC2_FULL_48_10]OGR21039.1 MAG: 2-amino-4-hydroxy-6-hydroxymethyldihydropteridine diphosphokinase [Desulfobacula sp. RIFOXYA12_FULL_46_16]OGR48481.1 MAG: 2-amino-4-hydroxy-6-hydroxymethyldihydropteridine diphosphokinase [Desulfobacula sp. RIFOXYB2_FULL_45_6]
MNINKEEHQAYLSIGSNRGDKRKNLDEAVNRLAGHERIKVMSISSFYMTEPQNFKDQDWFLNAALKIKTELGPEDLLVVLKQLEKSLDKDGKAFRFGPRTIDLDIIYYDSLVLKTGALEIPHPRMHERCFVLVPLCDIGPQEIHPVLKLSSDELLKKIELQETQKVMLLKEGE